jgi:hypothetical protein
MYAAFLTLKLKFISHLHQLSWRLRVVYSFPLAVLGLECHWLENGICFSHAVAFRATPATYVAFALA